MAKLLICVGLALLLHMQLGSSYILSQPHIQPGQPQPLPPKPQLNAQPLPSGGGAGPSGGPGNFCKCKPNGLYPDLSDKSHYYQCYQERTYQQTCAGGLVFDTSCKCCNWA